MGRFAQYLGKTEIEVDGKKLELDVKLTDLQKLMSKKATSDEGVTETTNHMLEMLTRSYPEEPPEELESFLTKNITEFIKQFSIAVLGVSEEDFKSAEKKAASQ